MKIIICGAENIGSGIAKYLAQEKMDVVVIDTDPERLRATAESFDVQTILGNPCHPPVLEKAGAQTAQLIVAVTGSDEVNILTCLVANELFKIPLKIAYIRNQVFLDPHWSHLFKPSSIPIDMVISPEREVARTIFQTIQVPGASDIISVSQERVKVIGTHCTSLSLIANTSIRQVASLFPHIEMNILFVVRDNELIFSHPHLEILPQDQVYFMAPNDMVPLAMQAFGYEQKTTRNVLILGAGNIGMSLAQEIEKNDSSVHVKIVELNRDIAIKAAQTLTDGMVICGDALDVQILIEANVANVDAVIAVTSDNEVNILASLLAKRNGASQAITVVNNPSYTPLITPLGIDSVISPRDITISSVLYHVRRGKIRSLFTLRGGIGELIEAEIFDHSPLINMMVKSVNDPKKLIIGAIVRDDQVYMATDSFVLRKNDLVILFAKSDAIKYVESLFDQKSDLFG